MRIIYTRSNAVNPDPRVEKEIASLVHNGYDVKLLCWNRCRSTKLRCLITKSFDICSRVVFNWKGSYGGGLKNLLGIIMFNSFLFFYLIVNLRAYDAIHAADLDTVLPALLIKIVFKKTVVYDVYDFYVDAFTVPRLLKSLVKSIDLFTLSSVDSVVLPCEARLAQIKGSSPKNIVYIHNSPPSLSDTYSVEISCPKPTFEVCITYVGNLQDHRLLLELLDLFKCRPSWRLIAAGFGKYHDNFAEASREYSNIDFYGKVSYIDSLRLSSEADILVATYSPSIPNHAYSSPNKLYEAMMLSKPLIVCENTSVDLVVIENKIGFVCNYNIQSLEEAINKFLSLSLRDKISIGQRANLLFHREYSWSIMEARMLGMYNQLENK